MTSEANYCIEDFDGDPSICAQTGDFTINDVSIIDDRTVEIALSANAQDQTYTVKASNLTDAFGNSMTDPDYADFQGVEVFRLLEARALIETGLQLIFTKPVLAGPDTPGSGDCNTPEACANRYSLLGVSDLGPIDQAAIPGAPYDNWVVLKHTNAQQGGLYTVIAANGLDGDGFDNASWGAIRAASGPTLGANPHDRSSFLGIGESIIGFDDGPIAVDPLGDGTPFSYIFEYRNRVYLGPNADGTGAIRMNGDGSSPESISFSFYKDETGGNTSDNNQPGPFPSIGRDGCDKDTYECGPDNENGRGLFTAGTIQGTEWLVIGGANSSGKLEYVYMSDDADTTLNMQYVDNEDNIGGATEGFAALHVFDDRVFLGLPDTGGKRPYLVSVEDTPTTSSQGLDTIQNSNGGEACDLGVHTSCYLDAEEMPAIGSGGDPQNDANTQLIDFIGDYNDLLYIGNNGGLVRATTTTPLDYKNWPDHWKDITPRYSLEYIAFDSVTTEKTSAIEPGDKAWPAMVVFNDNIYLIRNVESSSVFTRGAQLWTCYPEYTSDPDACDTLDWRHVAPNILSFTYLSQFNNDENEQATLLIVNGDRLYMGFNNDSGVSIYRTRNGIVRPTEIFEFEGQGGCIPGIDIPCQGLGGNGLGDPVENTRILDAVSVHFKGINYLYIAVGNGSNGLRIYRTQN